MVTPQSTIPSPLPLPNVRRIGPQRLHQPHHPPRQAVVVAVADPVRPRPHLHHARRVLPPLVPRARRHADVGRGAGSRGPPVRDRLPGPGPRKPALEVCFRFLLSLLASESDSDVHLGICFCVVIRGLLCLFAFADALDVVSARRDISGLRRVWRSRQRGSCGCRDWSRRLPPSSQRWGMGMARST
jgi:hypothetical protein